MTLSDGSIVSVFGANDPCQGDGDYDIAYQVGCVLAGLGYTLANGGYGGTMEASSKGAKSAGGKTIGVICEIWNSQPNEFIDEVVTTHDLSQRVNKLIELGSGGYVVLPGATGTLVELAWVWELMCKGLLEKWPLICVGDFWQPLIDMMVSKRKRSEGLIELVENPDGLKNFFQKKGTC